MKPINPIGVALLLLLPLMLVVGCVQPSETERRPTLVAPDNRVRALESRINRLEKDMEKVRAQQLQQRAGFDPAAGASTGLELRVRELELRLNALTNPKPQEPATPTGIRPENASPEQQALVARMAGCIRQSGDDTTTDKALHNAWRIAAGLTETGQLRQVTDTVCQSDAGAR